MKKIFFAFLLFFSGSSILSAEEFDKVSNHPRIFASAASLDALRGDIRESSNPQLLKMHGCLKKTADEFLSCK